MERSTGTWQWIGFAVTSFLGTILHFLYEWLNEAVWIAPFSGVNESTWEHMKLLFWPMLAFGAVEYLFFGKTENFWCIKLRGALLGLALIPVLFYTYNGIIGKPPDWINISIFFISAAASYLYETHLFNSGRVRCFSERAAIVTLLVIALMFVLFTFVTPEINIFRDGLTGTYGV